MCKRECGNVQGTGAKMVGYFDGGKAAHDGIEPQHTAALNADVLLGTRNDRLQRLAEVVRVNSTPKAHGQGKKCCGKCKRTVHV